MPDGRDGKPVRAAFASRLTNSEASPLPPRPPRGRGGTGPRVAVAAGRSARARHRPAGPRNRPHPRRLRCGGVRGPRAVSPGGPRDVAAVGRVLGPRGVGPGPEPPLSARVAAPPRPVSRRVRLRPDRGPDRRPRGGPPPARRVLPRDRVLVRAGQGALVHRSPPP